MVCPRTVEVAAAVLVLVAAAYDLRFRRIPNWLTMSGIVAGLALNTAAGGWPALRMAALGFVIAFGVNLALYALHAMGAGDVKLMAAIGALTGPWPWFRIFVLTALSGGVLALALMTLRRRGKKTLWNVAYILSELSHFRAPYLTRDELDVRTEKGMRLPRAVSIAVGTLAYLTWRG